MADASGTSTTWNLKDHLQKLAGRQFDEDNISEAVQLIRQVDGHCHIIGGQQLFPQVPLGCGLSVGLVWVDRERCYKTGGGGNDDGGAPAQAAAGERLGIGKDTLMRIAEAMGVDNWQIRRVDDGADYCYAEYEAKAQYIGLDGLPRTIGPASSDSDFRDGSPKIAGKTERAVNALRRDIKKSTATKAKLRVIREGFGIPHSMTEADLAKPFLCLRLVRTMRAKDPETRRMFAQVVAFGHLAASGFLYASGGQIPQLGSSGAMPKMLTTGVRPQVSRDGEVTGEWISDATFDGEVEEAPKTPVSGTPVNPTPAQQPRPAPPPPPPPVPAAPAGGSGGGRGNGGGRGWSPKWGNGKGKTAPEMSDQDLNFYLSRAKQSLADQNKANFHKYDREAIAAIEAEQATRKAKAAQREPDPSLDAGGSWMEGDEPQLDADGNPV